MNFYKYSFTSQIQRHSLGFNKRGELFYTVLFLPVDLTEDLPLDKNPRLRIEGEMQDIPFAGALQPAKGKWYLLVSRDFMNEQDLALGDSITVRFNISDQDHVELPTELENALAENIEALEIWLTLTPGKKRGYAAHVASAKKPITRENRAFKMIEYILAGKNAGGRPY